MANWETMSDTELHGASLNVRKPATRTKIYAWSTITRGEWSSVSVLKGEETVYIRADLVEEFVAYSRHTEKCFDAMSKSCTCTCGLTKLIEEIRSK